MAKHKLIGKDPDINRIWVFQSNTQSLLIPAICIDWNDRNFPIAIAFFWLNSVISIGIGCRLLP